LHKNNIHIEVTDQGEIQIKKVCRATSKALVKGGTAVSFNVPSAFKHTEKDSWISFKKSNTVTHCKV